MAFLFCQGKGLTMRFFTICVYNGVTKGGKSHEDNRHCY